MHNLGMRKSTYNVSLLGISFCIVFAAFNTTQNYVTTIASDFGFISLAILYFVFSVVSFIAPSLERKLGPRPSMLIGAVAYCVFIAACAIDPSPFLLLSAAALLGFGGALIWTAHGHYLRLNSPPAEVGFYSGLFFMLYQGNQIFGNLLSGILLAYSDYSMSTIFLILLCLCVLGTLLMLLMRKYTENEVFEIKGTRELLTAVFGLLCRNEMILLTPLVTLVGFHHAFIYGVIPLQLGKWIGFSMAVFGLFDSISSILFGRFSDRSEYSQELVCIICGLFELIGSMWFLFFFHSFSPWSLFLGTCLFGCADGGFLPQAYATMNKLFKNDSAVAVAGLKFVHAVTMGMGFLLGLFASPTIYVIVLITLTILALAAYHSLQSRIKSAKVSPG